MCQAPHSFPAVDCDQVEVAVRKVSMAFMYSRKALFCGGGDRSLAGSPIAGPVEIGRLAGRAEQKIHMVTALFFCRQLAFSNQARSCSTEVTAPARFANRVCWPRIPIRTPSNSAGTTHRVGEWPAGYTRDDPGARTRYPRIYKSELQPRRRRYSSRSQFLRFRESIKNRAELGRPP